MSERMDIDLKYFVLNNGACDIDIKKYNSLIIAKNRTSSGNYLYVLEDNEANRNLDIEWGTAICPTDGGICSGARDGMIVYYTEENGLFEHCLDQGYKSTYAMCEYQANKNCQVECRAGDVTNKCGTTYVECTDFNTGSGITDYINMVDDRESYILCDNDPDYCNLGCQKETWMPYICRNSVDGSIKSACNSPPAGCDFCRLRPQW